MRHSSTGVGAGDSASSEPSAPPRCGTDFAALVRDIPGYSAVGVLELLNRHVRLLAPPLRYGEVGSLNGLTLVGALFRNTARALAIDNLSECGATEAALRATLDRYRIADRVDVRTACFTTVFREGVLAPQSLGVYFYDGRHDEEAEYAGLRLAEPFLAPGALVVIDDTNWPAPRRAAERWIHERGLAVLQDIHTDDFRTSAYWNGLIVCRWKPTHEAAPSVSRTTPAIRG